MMADTSPVYTAIMFVLTVVTLITLAEVTLSTFSSGRVSVPAAGSGAAKRGAVASMDARCSKAGLEILEIGGNAVDAVGKHSTPRVLVVRLTDKLTQAIATEFCLGVIGEITPFALYRWPRDLLIPVKGCTQRESVVVGWR